MRRPAAIPLFLAAILGLAWAGCSPRVTTSTAPEAPARGSLPASSDEWYDYRVANDGCDCLEFTVNDEAAKVEYRLRASYKMQTGVFTEISFTIVNRSDDTLSFERGAIRVSSRNIRYQYNNKFLPLPWDPVLPRSSGARTLTGKEVTGESNWHKIAGEQLAVTVKGLSLGGRELRSQTINFIPENPNIGE
jgi:hypothetical protein